MQSGSRTRLTDRKWFAPVAIGACWIMVGAMAAGQEILVADVTPRWHAALPSLLAGLLWAVMSVPVIGLARTFPVRGTPMRVFLTLHGLASLAASFVLNTAFFLVLAALGDAPAGPLSTPIVENGIRWLHVNAGAYWAVIVVAHVLDRRLGGRSDTGIPTLSVATSGAHLRIPLDDIQWIEADGDYARVHARSRSYLLSRRMKELEEELDEAGFVRVHRSAIVHPDKVLELKHRSHGDYEAVLTDGTTVRVSRTRRDALLERFQPDESPA